MGKDVVLESSSSWRAFELNKSGSGDKLRERWVDAIRSSVKLGSYKGMKEGATDES